MSNPTPNGTRVIAHQADGTEVDVTEGVQALYDLVLSSMDWRSGFLTQDDAIPMLTIGRACGFDEGEVESYIGQQRAAVLRQEELLRTRKPPSGWAEVTLPEHEHIFTSPGRACAFPGCTVQQREIIEEPTDG